MSWIQTITAGQATGILKEFYDQFLERDGVVPNILQALSLKPDSLIALAKLRETLATGGSSLGRRKEELINVVVSNLNQCGHCMRSHGEALRRIDAEIADSVIQNWRGAKLSNQERVLLQFCEKVTLFRSQLGKSDVELLHGAGYSDRQVLEIVLLVAYRHFMNIVADALGVEDERTLAPGQKV